MPSFDDDKNDELEKHLCNPPVHAARNKKAQHLQAWKQRALELIDSGRVDVPVALRSTPSFYHDRQERESASPLQSVIRNYSCDTIDVVLALLDERPVLLPFVFDIVLHLESNTSSILDANRFKLCVSDWEALKTSAACRYSDPGLASFCQRFPFAPFYILGAVLQTKNKSLVDILLDHAPKGAFSGAGIELVDGEQYNEKGRMPRAIGGYGAGGDILWRTLVEGAEETAGLQIARTFGARVPVRSTVRGIAGGMNEPLPAPCGEEGRPRYQGGSGKVERWGLRADRDIKEAALALEAAEALFGKPRDLVRTGALNTRAGVRFAVTLRDTLMEAGGELVKEFFKKEHLQWLDDKVAGAGELLGEPAAKRQKTG